MTPSTCHGPELPLAPHSLPLVRPNGVAGEGVTAPLPAIGRSYDTAGAMHYRRIASGSAALQWEVSDLPRPMM
jgi:hypothetical protein